MDIRIWDVGHGLSVRVRTPNGQNHWIDAGGSPEFSPSEHVHKNYWEDSDVLDLLVISHPDQDHIEDLPNLVRYLGKPRCLLRNRTLSREEKYGSEKFEYQRVFKELDEAYTHPMPDASSPLLQSNNGGLTIRSFSLGRDDVSSANDSSLVVFYRQGGSLIVFPGDISNSGWEQLSRRYAQDISELLVGAQAKVLVAPHHGRTSGFSQSMMDIISPHLCVISDEHGEQPTDRRFRELPSGLVVSGRSERYLSTKTGGRIRISLSESGGVDVHQE